MNFNLQTAIIVLCWGSPTCRNFCGPFFHCLSPYISLDSKLTIKKELPQCCCCSQINPELVVVLDVGSSHVLNDESTGEYISVTLIDANHCPGSVMFLFQGKIQHRGYLGKTRKHSAQNNSKMTKNYLLLNPEYFVNIKMCSVK